MKILISAGPTREAIDPVRFLSNRSTGKMGYALALAAAERGDDVTLVSGPVSLTPPAGVKVIQVTTAAEMAAAMKKAFPDAELTIMAAAVADYRPKTVLPGKMKKAEAGLTMELERTEDILLSLGRVKRPGRILAGFAAETENLEANALEKLKRKNLDFIVANDVSKKECGFESDTNQVTIYASDGTAAVVPLAGKPEVAREILSIITGEKR